METSPAICKGKCNLCRPFAVLLLLLFLQFSLFVITLLISYAVESGVAHLHHILFDLTPPLPLETSLMLYCVSLIAECITEVQHKNWTILSFKKHHIMLIVIPNIVYILVFSLAFINIFIEFQAFHSFDQWHFGVPEASAQTAIYMVSISYIVFCLTRLVRKDLFQLFLHLPHHQHSHSVVLLIGFLMQCIYTTIYSLPMLLIGYVANHFRWHVATEFTVMNTLGCGMGVIGSYVERKVPWPNTKKRRSKPYFWYENIIYSRVVFLEVVLLPSFHYLFFEPGKLNFLNTKDRHVVYFTFCVSVSLVHIVKILTTAVTQHGSADLIFGWAWGRPHLRSRSHMSQSGLDGGFLKEWDDINDNNETKNSNTNTGMSNGSDSSHAAVDMNLQTRNNNVNSETTDATGNNIEGGLPSFSFPRDLIKAPISTLVFYGLKYIHRIDTDKENNVETTDDDENITENVFPIDPIISSVSSIPGDLIQANSILDVSHNVQNSEDINLNNAVVVPGIVNKGVDNFNNNFRNQNIHLITAGRSK